MIRGMILGAFFFVCAIAFAVEGVPVRGANTAPKITVSADLKVKPFSLARVKLDGVPAGAGVVWRVYPNVGISRATTARDTLEFVAPPGVYAVEILVIRNGKDGIEIDEQTISVEFEQCCQDKKPPTQPPEPKTPKSKANPEKAIGKIQFGDAGCSATVVAPRRSDGRWDVLTAAHCVSAIGQRGKLYTQDGRALGVSVVSIHENQDLCWLVTDDKIEEMEYAEIASDDPQPKVKIWHKGYGIDKPGNRESGEVVASADSNGQLRFLLSVSSGDSGGGIFREDTGELISAVCCTTQKGAKASVWGGSTTEIRRTRPRGNSREIWTPTPIPERAKFTGFLWGFVPSNGG